MCNVYDLLFDSGGTTITISGQNLDAAIGPVYAMSLVIIRLAPFKTYNVGQQGYSDTYTEELTIKNAVSLFRQLKEIIPRFFLTRKLREKKSRFPR